MSELPENLAEEVVENLRQRAEAAGTSLTELLRSALQTQTGFTDTPESPSNS